MGEIRDINKILDSLPWLCIESIGKNASLAVVFEKNDQLQIKTENIESRAEHTDSLVPFVEKISETSVGKLQKIRKFVLINGPGSFTGLRVANSMIHGLAFGLGGKVVSVSLFELFAFAWLIKKNRSKSIKSDSLHLNIVLNSRLGEYFCGLVKCEQTDKHKTGKFFPWWIDLKEPPTVKTSDEVSSWKSREHTIFCPKLTDFCWSGAFDYLNLNVNKVSFSVIAVLYQLMVTKKWHEPGEVFPLYVKNKVAQSSLERRFEPPLHIRGLSIRDISLLKQIEDQAYEFGWSEGNFLDALNEDYVAKALINNSVMVGYYFWQKVLNECHLLNFTIASERQRKGLGNWMLSQLIESVKTRSIEAIYLEVRPSNDTAISLYAKFGFSIIGRRKNYYPEKEGREDALVMKRRILN